LKTILAGSISGLEKFRETQKMESKIWDFLKALFINSAESTSVLRNNGITIFETSDDFGLGDKEYAVKLIQQKFKDRTVRIIN